MKIMQDDRLGICFLRVSRISHIDRFLRIAAELAILSPNETALKSNDFSAVFIFCRQRVLHAPYYLKKVCGIPARREKAAGSNKLCRYPKPAKPAWDILTQMLNAAVVFPY